MAELAHPQWHAYQLDAAYKGQLDKTPEDFGVCNDCLEMRIEIVAKGAVW